MSKSGGDGRRRPERAEPARPEPNVREGSAAGAVARPSVAPPRGPRWDLHPLQHLRHDLPAGLVVFLVALPLCLGVALASGAPPLAGLVAGCVGGVVVPLVSRAPLSVSGPAAGLAAIVLTAVERHGFPVVCAATVVAGAVQLGLGLFRAGVVISFVPSSVIRGMLTAIGILLMVKQVPHAIGYDRENFAGESFEVGGEDNAFAFLLHAVSRLEWGAVLVSVASLSVLWGWDALGLKKRLPSVPAALVAVLAGSGLAAACPSLLAAASLDRRHFVEVPTPGLETLSASLGAVSWPALLAPETWILGAMIGVVASLESLLCLDAVDRLDPFKRRSDANRELLAQGLGNALSGALGGLPITSVIVRSGANVDAGGRTQAAALTHGILLLGAILALSEVLNRIPLAALAAILIWTGGKLAHPSVFGRLWRRGPEQWIPFAVTIAAIVLTDLLQGVVLGIVVGQALSVRSAMRNAVRIEDAGEVRTIRFEKDIFFFHKAAILAALDRLPEGTKRVIVDAGSSDHVELDVREAVFESRENVERQGAALEVVGLAPVDG